MWPAISGDLTVLLLGPQASDETGPAIVLYSAELGAVACEVVS